MPAVMSYASRDFSHKANVSRLVILFAAWKLLLLLVAIGSPGPGYDTSTQLLLPASSYGLLRRVLSRLVRWDALYFVSIAQRGYLYEQEWAFGWGFTRLVAFVSGVLPASIAPLVAEAFLGSLLAHVFHAFSVLLLYLLTLQVIPENQVKRELTALIAACLHLLSPAGLFLSSPNAESLFSCLNFLGMLCYVKAEALLAASQPAAIAPILIIAAGAIFGLASTVRGNGILSGTILLHQFVLVSRRLSEELLNPIAMSELVALGMAGLLTAAGTILPQLIAYQDYCYGGEVREWCSRTLPSIYTFVQEHYWNVGFLRYWTLSNLPLFLLAIPMLAIMLFTGLEALFHTRALLPAANTPRSESDKAISVSKQDSHETNARLFTCFQQLAVPQVLLGVLTLSNFHVQIINRISSGYPVWYMVIAIYLTAERRQKDVKGVQVKSSLLDLATPKVQQWLVRSMIMYAVIQGGLYASFLPPA